MKGKQVKKLGNDEREGVERRKGERGREEKIEGKEVQSRRKGSNREMPLIRSSERFFS